MANETDGEIRVTPWRLTDDFKCYGLDGYRIWNKQTPHGMFQRHEWKRSEGGSDVEDWIPSTPSWSVDAAPIEAAA